MFIPLTVLVRIRGIFLLGRPLSTELADFLLCAPLLFGVLVSVGLGAATIVQGPAAILAGDAALGGITSLYRLVSLVTTRKSLIERSFLAPLGLYSLQVG